MTLSMDVREVVSCVAIRELELNSTIPTRASTLLSAQVTFLPRQRELT